MLLIPSGFVAHVLTTLPQDELADKSFRIQGQRITLSELGKRSGLEVVHTEALPDHLSAAQTKTFIQTITKSGKCSSGWNVELGKDVPEDAGMDNKLWSGHVWLTSKDLFGY